MTERLDHNTYSKHVDEVFRLELDKDNALDLTLIEVTAAGPATTQHAKDAGRPTPFSLLFRGPPEPVLPQAIYPLTHPELGLLEIFLVPIGPTGDGMGYDAVFS